jgi:uncharacterized SAM-dependent methyltransferase
MRTLMRFLPAAHLNVLAKDAKDALRQLSAVVLTLYMYNLLTTLLYNTLYNLRLYYTTHTQDDNINCDAINR